MKEMETYLKIAIINRDSEMISYWTNEIKKANESDIDKEESESWKKQGLTN